jgi:hypothetical protein
MRRDDLLRFLADIDTQARTARNVEGLALAVLGLSYIVRDWVESRLEAEDVR